MVGVHCHCTLVFCRKSFHIPRLVWQHAYGAPLRRAQAKGYQRLFSSSRHCCSEDTWLTTELWELGGADQTFQQAPPPVIVTFAGAKSLEVGGATYIHKAVLSALYLHVLLLTPPNTAPLILNMPKIT